MSGFYFVVDSTYGYARVSKYLSNTLDHKEEAIFEGVYAEQRAIEYANWMNREDDGDFDREPSNPNPETPRETSHSVSLQGLQGRRPVFPQAVDEGCRVERRDILRPTRNEICDGEPES